MRRRTLLALIALALPVAVAASAGTAQAVVKPVKATGTIVCTSATGSVTFIPALKTVPSGVSEVLKIKLQLAGCGETSTNVTSSTVTGSATGKATLTSNNCNVLTSSNTVTGSLAVHWTGAVGTAPMAPTKVKLSALNGLGAGNNGNVGLAFTNQTASGSFDHQGSAEMDSSKNLATVTSGCGARTGLPKLSIVAGHFQAVLPAPTFTVERVLSADYGTDAVALDTSTQTVYAADFGLPQDQGTITTFKETDTQSTMAPVGPPLAPTGVVFDSGSLFWLNSHLTTQPTPQFCPPQTADAVIHNTLAPSGVGSYNLPPTTAVAMTADTSTHTLYVLSCTGTLYVVPESRLFTGSGTVGTVLLPPGGSGLAVDPSTHNVYVAMGMDGIDVIDESGDANNGTVVQTFPYHASELTVDPSTHMVYAFPYSGTTFAIIDESGDASNGTIVAQPQIAGGDTFQAWAAAVDPSTHYVYVSGSDQTLNEITGFVVDEANDGYLGQIFSGPFDARAIAIDSSTHLAFAAASPLAQGSPGHVSVIGTG
jgi:hypothetical protein